LEEKEKEERERGLDGKTVVCLGGEGAKRRDRMNEKPS
jgi:hypothetical protein